MYITEVILHIDRYPTERYYPFNVPTLRRTSRLALDKPVVEEEVVLRRGRRNVATGHTRLDRTGAQRASKPQENQRAKRHLHITPWTPPFPVIRSSWAPDKSGQV